MIMEVLRSGPYLERQETDAGAVEGFLSAAAERVALRVAGRQRRLAALAARVEALAEATTVLTDADIRERGEALRPRLLKNGFADEAVIEAFALIREVSFRRLAKRHYPVQIMGGMALVAGMIAEMQTGEGKTITAALAAITAALSGLPVHVVTVNDYLAERDGEILRPVYEAFGLTLGTVRHGQSPEERRAAYAADIVHGANMEIAFDYLRDRIALGARRGRSQIAVARLERDAEAEPELFLRGLGFAIVDEADSVLVDEARTPLIISYPAESPDNADVYPVALEIARRLVVVEDFTMAPALMDVTLTERGKQRVEEGDLAKAGGGVFVIRRARVALVRSALAALHLYRREKHYVVREGKVEIVDEATGRIAEGRSWEGGLHQLIECKEDCAPSELRETRARITYQRFFRRYVRLAGMSGTVSELAGELGAVYGLSTVRIPPNRPNRRVDRGLRLMPTLAQKWSAVAEAAILAADAGRPVLIGTQTIEESQALSCVLAARGVEHVVLNAHQDQDEAEIVARSGEPRRITVATNMAGRGTDIQLAPGVADSGGLHVIVTSFSDSTRIDRQLIGRGGRQGDPSSFEAIVSIEDELFAKFSPYSRILARTLARGGAERGVAPLLRRHAQGAAERYNLAMRRATLQADRDLQRSLSFSGEAE